MTKFLAISRLTVNRIEAVGLGSLLLCYYCNTTKFK